MVNEVQKRLLDRLPADFDKSEGSLLWDMTKAIAIELKDNGYEKLPQMEDRIFVYSAEGQDLNRKATERGIARKAATKAKGAVVIKGTDGTMVLKGTLVAADTVEFVTLQDGIIAGGSCEVEVECMSYGIVGNIPALAVKKFPVTLAGLVSAENPNPISGGFDLESDDDLKERILEKAKLPATSGNKYHYMLWAKEIVGVGDVKVVPTWNGPGTVKIILVDANGLPADATLTANVKGNVESKMPIGATPTVVSANSKTVTVSLMATLSNGYTKAQVVEEINGILKAYFKEIALSEASYISYAYIGSKILESKGVSDYTSLTVNDGTANITLNSDEVAVLSEVVILD